LAAWLARNWFFKPPLRGQFVVHGQELPTAYVHAKFEDRSFTHFRNIGTFRCGALIDPVTLTFDLDVGVGVACHLGYPCAKFRLPRPFGYRVRADIYLCDIRRTDGQTDDGRRWPLNAPPTGRGHNKSAVVSCSLSWRCTYVRCWYRQRRRRHFGRSAVVQHHTTLFTIVRTTQLLLSTVTAAVNSVVCSNWRQADNCRHLCTHL